MDLVVVNVSYNTRQLLEACLVSVFDGLRRSSLAGQVWVVDNASDDGSAEMVAQRFPLVRLIAHEKNQGFAAGNNLALERMKLGQATNPRHVLFLNPDTIVRGDALGVMVRFLDGTPRAGAAGARLVHGNGNRLVDSRLNGRYPRDLYAKGEPFPVDHPLGAALMVRAETLAQVGGFDDRFFMYCEEIDLCRRIKAAGWDIYCLPQAEIVHLVGQSTRQFRDKMFVALWRSRFLMFDKHDSALFRWTARRLVHLGLQVETRRARAAHRRAEISAEELAGRMAAYQEVAAL